jgi:FixJ family two-component response regulator
VRAFLCASLERAGYHAEGAESGPQGLALAASRVYDAIVVDQVLPGLVGLDLLRMLSNADIHVATVLITGHGADAFRDDAMALGVVECLDKPVRSPVLVGAIARAMARSASPLAGGPLFRDLDGRPRRLVERLARTLTSSPTTATRADVLRRLARAAVDSQLSLHEFIAVSHGVRRVADTPDGALDAALLLTIAADLRARSASPGLAAPPLAAYLGLLGREPSACGLSVAASCERLGIRVAELDHACASVGLTPHGCRHACQMRRAVRVLVEASNEHVKQLAYQLGYEHPTNFTRAFGGFFGLSPQQFRRLLSPPASV